MDEIILKCDKITNNKSFEFHLLNSLKNEIKQDEEILNRKKDFYNLLISRLQYKKEIPLAEFNSLVVCLRHSTMPANEIFKEIP